MEEIKDGNVDIYPKSLQHIELCLNMCYASACKYAYAVGRKKPVLQISKSGLILAEFESAAEAGRKMGIKSDYITESIRGYNRRKTAGGYYWKYKEN